MLNKQFVSRVSFWAAIAVAFPLVFPLLCLAAILFIAFLLPLGCCTILPFIILRRLFLSLQSHQFCPVVESDASRDRSCQAQNLGSPEEVRFADTVTRGISSGERNSNSSLSPTRGTETDSNENKGTRQCERPHLGSERTPSTSIFSSYTHEEREETDSEHAEEHEEDQELEATLHVKSLHDSYTEPYTNDEDVIVQNSGDHNLVCTKEIVSESLDWKKERIMEPRAPQACKDQVLIDSEDAKNKGVSDELDGQHKRNTNISNVKDVFCHFEPKEITFEENSAVIPSTLAIRPDMTEMDESQTVSPVIDMEESPTSWPPTPVIDMEESPTSWPPTPTNVSVYESLPGSVEDDGLSSSDTLATNFDGDSSRSDYESATAEDCFEEIQVTDEEKTNIHHELDAIKKIVGCSGDSHMSLTDQIAAVYVFTGMKPPFSVQEVDNLEKARKELELLKLVIGVK